MKEPNEGVKSARRVFEFLEYYAKVQRAVSVAELANHFGYPNSSVSSVMRTMVAMGYLSYNATTRSYLPTARLPFLNNWIGTRLFDHDRIWAMMLELSDATGETILLGVQIGLRLQYTQVIDAKGPVRLHAESGSFRGLTTTAAGLMLLSRFDDRTIGQLIRRINDEGEAELINLPEVLQKIEAIRRDGHCVSIGGVVPGAGAIAMLLPKSVGETPLAIGVSSVESVIVQNRDAYIDLMKKVIKRHVNGDSEQRSRRAT
ncbi:helix-turn-helix domain-containing protein [Bradyrhizobium sp. LHD-71]|uniref:IclR family transcriptional regulator n=1 Tax=Bradyrhizobium sp. LHD-71 TaxID=3072141 RepID=UPI00280CD7F2|nr:helix-turn-helix domain-containing protein [Bradyrhizobium sp. LHD-71]MDQ8731977.1 helix-turn-helix domain-containing protein [Bradyrhizobium sp. LHD-71]